MIPKNALASAAAADDAASVSTQEMFREIRGLNGEFVFVSPKGTPLEKTTDGNGVTASGESFISCDDASSSTTEGVAAKNKRKRVRKRKKKTSIVENVATPVLHGQSTVEARPNPFKEQPIVAKPNNSHVRYVRMLNLTLLFLSVLFVRCAARIPLTVIWSAHSLH